MKSIILFPGTFDPITSGHISIIKRSLSFFDQVHILVANNSKKNTIFNLEERVKLIQEVVMDDTSELSDKVVVSCTNTLVPIYCQEHKIHFIIRGIRSVFDLNFETQLYNGYKLINPNLEVIFLFTDDIHGNISATMIREIYSNGKSIANLPATIDKYLKQKLTQ